MTTRTLKLAKNLSLPINTVTQKLAWLGTTGSGKTYGASKAAELFVDAGAQIVVLDPVGVWYGMRLAADGKKPSGITIPIFGGLHGDVPLESTGGELMANLIVDNALSVILDVSQFESDADKARFAAAFANRFFFRKKAQPSAVHLFLEECQEFVPQNPQRGEEHMLHAFVRMQKLGRNFGIGASYISQRPQEVNKKALNMAQTLFVFRTTGTHERTAIEKWIEDKSLDESIANDLPKIETGHCHVWSPEFLKISEMVQILPKETFNASATPEVGAAAKARELAPIDLDLVRTEMAATIEKAKADDPKELRRQIAELKKQAASIQSAKPEVTKTVTGKVVEKPVLTDADRARLEKVHTRLDDIGSVLLEGTTVIADRLAGFVRDAAQKALTDIEAKHATSRERYLALVESKGVQKILDKLKVVSPQSPVPSLAGRRADGPARAGTSRVVPTSTTTHERRRPGVPAASGTSDLGKGERTTLTAIAQYPAGVTREQLTILTGYTRSSRNTFIQRLSTAGFVDVSGERVLATDAGVTALGDFDPLPTGDALRQHWLTRLSGGEQEILRALAVAYPNVVDREALSESTGYTRSSRNTYLQRLGARQLIVSVGGGVRASEELFD